MKGLKFVLLSFLVWRTLLFLPLFVSEQALSYRQGYDYTNIWKFTKPYEPVSNFLLYPWANFDGVHYLSIAGRGYTNDDLGFFPLFPLTISASSSSFGTGEAFGAAQFFAGFFVSNLAFIAALFVLYKLIELDYPIKTARLAILFLLVFPTSFYFGSIYSESLFLLLALLTLYFARKKQLFAGSFLGLLASLARLVGIALLPALIYELFRKEKTAKKRLIAALLFLIIPLGYIGYSFFNWTISGNAFSFIQAHATLGNARSVDTVILIPQTLFRYGKILFSLPHSQFEWWIAVLELATFIFAALLIFYAWKKGVRFSYILFALVAFLIPASSGTFTGLPRYTLVIFPIFIALALIKNRLVQIAYVTTSLILLFILLMFFSKGYFIA